MVKTRMMAVREELLEELEGFKVIPRESISDCLQRVLEGYKQFRTANKRLKTIEKE